MNNESIGLLEEMILLIVMKEDSINGAEVLRVYTEIFQRSISLPAIIAVLKRLEKKGFLESYMGEPTEERGGGNRKRLYKATKKGVQIATSIQNNRNFLWAGI